MQHAYLPECGIEHAIKSCFFGVLMSHEVLYVPQWMGCHFVFEYL